MQVTGAAAATSVVSLGAGEVAADSHTINALIADMTVAEKAGQMIHTAGCNKLKEFATPGWRISLRTYSRQYQPVIGALYPEGDLGAFDDIDTIGTLLTDVGPGSLLSGGSAPPSLDPVELAEGVNTLQEYAINNSPHGIPFFYGIDAVHGADYLEGATTLPSG